MHAISKFRPYRSLMASVALGLLATACATAPSAPPRFAALPSSVSPQQDYDWHFSREDGVVQLAYGVANSDDIPFALECTPASGRVQISAVSEHKSVTRFTLATPSQQRTYNAKQEDAIMFDGFHLLAETTSDDPVLSSFADTGWLAMDDNGAWFGMAPHNPRQLKAKDFLTACRR